MGTKRIDKMFYTSIITGFIQIIAGFLLIRWGVFNYIASPSFIFSLIILGVTAIIIIASGISVFIVALRKYKIPIKFINEIHYGEVITSNSEQVIIVYDQYTHRQGSFRREYQRSEFSSPPKVGDIIKAKINIKNIGRDS